jgi:hypothetical protein
MTSITINLPDDLAARAQRAGVLRSQFVSSLIEEATRFAAAQNLRTAWSDMDAIAAPELSERDIATSIKAVRAAHRAETGS